MNAYLDPATELDRLRHENANLNGLLTLRSAALNRTGTQNDHLRATLNRISKHVDDGWRDNDGQSTAATEALIEISATLDSLEPTT